MWTGLPGTAALANGTSLACQHAGVGHACRFESAHKLRLQISATQVIMSTQQQMVVHQNTTNYVLLHLTLGSACHNCLLTSYDCCHGCMTSHRQSHCSTLRVVSGSAAATKKHFSKPVMCITSKRGQDVKTKCRVSTRVFTAVAAPEYRKQQKKRNCTVRTEFISLGQGSQQLAVRILKDNRSACCS